MRKERYQAQSIAEDLEYFSQAWRDGATDTELRRGSAILRRLLVDGANGEILNYWRRMKFDGHPLVMAPSLSVRVLAAGSRVVLATAGGARVNGAEMSGYLQSTERIDDDFNPAGHEQRLLDYLASPVIVVRGEHVTRRELVKYFAHDLGGVHLNRRALKKEAETGRILDGVESVEMRPELVGKDLIHFELLAVGQAIGNSADCARLAKAIREGVA